MKKNHNQNSTTDKHSLQKRGGDTAVQEVRRQRMMRLLCELKRLFPTASMALRYDTDWELLVAVILSARCTDKKVNEVTERLFKKYPTLDAYVRADPEEFARDIHATGFFRNKTKNILAAAHKVKHDFGGVLPRIMVEMLTIPGVARKTANVVLGNVYGVVEGIAVDTHVKRFAIRYDLTDHTDSVKIERDLMELVPQKEWFTFTYRVIEYGRQIAPARKYDTSKDSLVALYPPAGKKFRV